jgi:hypothetical protein
MPILEGLYPEREQKTGVKPSIPPLASAEPASRNGSAGSAAPFAPLAPLVPAAAAAPVAEISVILPGATDPMALAQAAAAAAGAAAAAAVAAAGAATAAAEAATAAAQAAASAAAAAQAARDQWTSLLASPAILAAAPEPAALPPARLVEPEPGIATVHEAPGPAPVQAASIVEAAPIAQEDSIAERVEEQEDSIAERIEEPPSQVPTAMVDDAPRPQPVPAVQAAPAPAPQPAARPQVRIDYIRVSNLTAFARAASADPQRYSVLPIAPKRAEAQALNPLADPDDIGLIVGYVGDRCAGYLGLLPGAIDFRGLRHPVSCLSGFYVAPGDRTSGLATNLPLAAMNLGRDLYVSRINDEARDLFTQLGFWPAQSQRILRLRLSRFKKLKGIPLRALVRSVSGGADVQNAWQLVTEAKTPMTAVWVDDVPKITAASDTLAPSERPRFVRDEGVINWMVRHPWICEGSDATLPYALPYRREMFRYMVLEASRGGYVVLNVTQDDHSATLRILDRRPMTAETRAPALARALVEAQRIGADLIECPAEYEPLLRSTIAGRVLMAADERGALVYTRNQNGPFGKYLDAIDWSGFEGDAPYY